MDTDLLAKLYDSQGLPRPGGPEDPKASQKLVFRGKHAEERPPGSPLPPPPGTADSADAQRYPAGVRALCKALKAMCPLHAAVNALCFWELPVTDDGLKGIVDFAIKAKPVSLLRSAAAAGESRFLDRCGMSRSGQMPETIEKDRQLLIAKCVHDG